MDCFAALAMTTVARHDEIHVTGHLSEPDSTLSPLRRRRRGLPGARGAAHHGFDRCERAKAARRCRAARVLARRHAAQPAQPVGAARADPALPYRLPQRAGPVPRGQRGGLGSLVHAARVDQGRGDGPAQSLDQPELCRAQDQGCHLRPLSRQGQRRAPRRRHPVARCAHLHAPEHRFLLALHRHLGRAAVQARLARRQGRGAAQGNTGRRHAGRLRLGRRRW